MKYFLMGVCMLLAACGSQSLTVTTQAAKLTVAKPIEPTPLQMLPIDFKVMNKTNQEEQIKQLLIDNESFVAITVRDYENLRINLSDVLRYIQQQQAMIKYYEAMTADKETPHE